MVPAVDLSAAVWRKSSRSGNTGSNDNCVELAHVDAAIALRDSKTPTDGALVLATPAWSQLATRLGDANHTA